MFASEALICIGLCAVLAVVSVEWDLFDSGNGFSIFALLVCYSFAIINFQFFISNYFSTAQAGGQFTCIR